MKTLLSMLIAVSLVCATCDSNCMKNDQQKNTNNQTTTNTNNQTTTNTNNQTTTNTNNQTQNTDNPTPTNEKNLSSPETIQITNPNYTNQDLSASIAIPTHVPTKQGKGLLWSSRTFFTNKRNLFLEDLINGHIDVDNTSDHHLLNSSIEEFVSNGEDGNLIKTIIISHEKFNGLLKPGNSESVKAHIYLTKTNKEKQDLLKGIVTSHHEKIIAETNKRLSNIQKLLSNEIDEFEKYIREEEKTVTTACDEIRAIKRALLTLHTLNKTFVLPVNGYCSDKDQQSKKTKNLNDLFSFYNNNTILKKINMNNINESTTQQVDTNLKGLKTIQTTLNSIPALTYGDKK